MRLRIPSRPQRRVPQPQRTRQIDDPHARVGKPWRELRRRHIRQREKHQIGVARQRLRIEWRDAAAPDPGQCRQLARRRRARGGGRHNRNVRVTSQQPEQFLPGVAGCTCDRDAHGVSRAAGGRFRLGNCMHRKEYLYRTEQFLQ